MASKRDNAAAADQLASLVAAVEAGDLVAPAWAVERLRGAIVALRVV